MSFLASRVLRLLSILLPALIPSWRFFREVGPAPRIECRLLGPDGPWFDPIPRPTRISLGAQLGRLVWNARWNEYLYLVTCAERTIADPAPFFEQELKARLASHLAPCEAEAFALRIRLVTEDDSEGAVAYISDPVPFAEGA